MKILINKTNPAIRITAPEIGKVQDPPLFGSYYTIKEGDGIQVCLSESYWTLVEEEETTKIADSILPNCTANAKSQNRWHKVSDSLPDNGRLVLAQDNLGNRLLARYDGEGNWEVSVYDNEDYYCRNTITKWCEIPS